MAGSSDGVFETEIKPSDLDGGAVLIEAPIGRLAIIRTEGRIVAFDAWCPHLDGPLWEGSVADGEVGCPWHAWRYSLKTGACTWAPQGDAEEAAETEIRVLECEIGPSGHVSVVLS